jgi:hypothetical protein
MRLPNEREHIFNFYNAIFLPAAKQVILEAQKKDLPAADAPPSSPPHASRAVVTPATPPPPRRVLTNTLSPHGRITVGGMSNDSSASFETVYTFGDPSTPFSSVRGGGGGGSLGSNFFLEPWGF